MPQTCCCVPLCHNIGGHRFPSDTLITKKWLHAIHRRDWHSTVTSVVCREHFQPSDYLQNKTFQGQDRSRRRLRADAVPSIFTWTVSEDNAVISERIKGADRSLVGTEVGSVGNNFTCITGDVECVEEIVDDDVICVDDACVPQSTVEISDAVTQTENQPFICIESIRNDDVRLLDLTGLATYAKFNFAFLSLGPAVSHLDYYRTKVVNLSPENQFLLMLVKLRKHYTDYDLSCMFGVSRYTVENVFVTWVNFTYLQWKEIHVWPSQDDVQRAAPCDFNIQFPSTRIILDGTEMPVKKSSIPTSQRQSFSSYKNRNTAKVVVGITPGGYTSYVSPAYGGSATDRQIIERTELPKMCDGGDSIMVDKGFKVQDLFAPYDVKINIPSFFKGRNKIKAKTLLRDRSISKKRVHVERVIGQAKTYKILKDPMCATETVLASRISFICFMLCNFRKGIVPPDA